MSYSNLLRRVIKLENLLYLEGKKDQEILNNFLGDDYYNKYQSIKNKIKDPEYKDIYKMIKMDPDEVKNYIDNFQSNRDRNISAKQSGAKLIYSDDTWRVYKITSYDAAKHYGKGTKWCISGNYSGHEERGKEYFYNYIKNYNLDGGYYFYINKKDSEKKYCLLQSRDGEIRSIWDASDRDLGSENTMGLPVVSGVNLKVVDPSDELNKLLLDGAQRGDIKSVKKALSMGVDVNVKDEALIEAALYDHPKIVKLLIDEGADVNAKDLDGATSLMHAAGESPRIVKLLIDAGADVNAKDRYDYTALIRAADSDQDKAVKLLLDAGADVNAKPKNGLTALINATRYDSTKIAKLLIDAGADVNIEDWQGNTALMLAVERYYSKMVRLLINAGANVNTKDKHGNTALKIALENGYNDIAKLLVKHGAKFESRRKYNRLNRKYLY